VVVLDRLVARRRSDGADPPIERVLRRCARVSSEVAVDRFANDRREARSPPGSLVLELAIGRLGKTQVGRHIAARHRGTTISPTAVPSQGTGWRAVGNSRQCEAHPRCDPEKPRDFGRHCASTREVFPDIERFWLNLQTRYDLEIEKDRLGGRLEKEVAVLARAS
jgi:hypothetical protein